jgi:hypothetical protein
MTNPTIDDLVQYDSIYRSDGPTYSRFRSDLLKRHQRYLNPSYRQNTYLPLRILLLETTRTRTKHSLNDLMLLLQMSRKKGFDASAPTPPQEVNLLPWQSISAPIQGPGPVSCLRLAPNSYDHFAFSTIDGGIHFGKLEVLQLTILSTVTVPTFSFYQFQWVTQHLICGIGFAAAGYLVSSDSHLWEFSMPSLPSEIVRYPGADNLCVVGDRTGMLYSFDLSNIPLTKQVPLGTSFQQPTSATLSHADVDVRTICRLGKPVTALAATAESATLVAGTSEGEVFLVAVETKLVRKWRVTVVELRPRSIQRVILAKLMKELHPVSIDCLSSVVIDDNLYFAVNMRNERAGLFVSEDHMAHSALVKEFRLPSLRAKCPIAVTEGKQKWVVVTGSDMGDLLIAEKDASLVSLTLHETTVSVVEWLPRGRSFISGDVNGMVAFWAKT